MRRPPPASAAPGHAVGGGFLVREEAPSSYVLTDSGALLDGQRRHLARLQWAMKRDPAHENRAPDPLLGPIYLSCFEVAPPWLWFTASACASIVAERFRALAAQESVHVVATRLDRLFSVGLVRRASMPRWRRDRTGHVYSIAGHVEALGVPGAMTDLPVALAVESDVFGGIFDDDIAASARVRQEVAAMKTPEEERAEYARRHPDSRKLMGARDWCAPTYGAWAESPPVHKNAPCAVLPPEQGATPAEPGATPSTPGTGLSRRS